MNCTGGKIIHLKKCHQFIHCDTILWLPTPGTLIFSHIVRFLVVINSFELYFVIVVIQKIYLLFKPIRTTVYTHVFDHDLRHFINLELPGYIPQ